MTYFRGGSPGLGGWDVLTRKEQATQQDLVCYYLGI